MDSRSTCAAWRWPVAHDFFGETTVNMTQHLGHLCSDWLDDLERLVAGDLIDIVRQLRATLQAELAAPSVRVVVCGGWKVGKTRLVNALVAAPDLLPVDDEHDTPYVAE